MMHKWDAERALELIERERVTNFVGVPDAVAGTCSSRPDFAERDTSSLASRRRRRRPGPARAGAPHRRQLPGSGRPQHRLRHDRDQRLRPRQHRRRLRAQARPAPGGRCRSCEIADRATPTAAALPAGEVGEIWFTGPTLIRGYWNKPEATAETIVDGWLHTGDLGRLDDEGFVFIVDRAKDMVIRGGENIYCAEVEAALYEHPAVYEAAVFGVPHERLGEEVAAAVVPRPGRDHRRRGSCRAFLAERLAAFKVPTRGSCCEPSRCPATPPARSSSASSATRSSRPRAEAAGLGRGPVGQAPGGPQAQIDTARAAAKTTATLLATSHRRRRRRR